MLSELYSQNILEQLDEFALGILSTAAVFEPRKNQHMPHLSKAARKVKRVCEEMHEEIKKKEMKYRIYPVSKPAYFHLSASIEGWLRGTNFDKILQFTDTDEGEVVRYFRMAIQILREISDAPVSSHILKEKIKETIRVINRDIVDAEKQLREG
jgi:superfamily II RNA helicase